MSERPAARGPALLALVLLLAGLAHAWIHWQPPLSGRFRFGFVGQNAARYSLAGRNYVRNGFTAGLGAPDFTPGEPGARRRFLYLHHPPLAPLAVGASFALFGESERSAALPFLAAGLLSAVLVFLVARRCMNAFGAGAAALLFASAPMTGIYGAHVDPQGPLLTASLLAATWSYLRFREHGRALDRALIFAFIVAGLGADWPAAFAALLLPFADRARAEGRADPGLRALPLAALGCGLLFAIWIGLMGRFPAAELFDAAGVRSPFALLAEGPAEIAREVGQFVSNLSRLFGLPLLAFVALGAVPELRRAAQAGANLRAALVVLGGTGAAHVLLFPQGAFVHDYWTFLLLPAAALLGGAALAGLASWIGERRGAALGLGAALALLGLAAYLGSRETRAWFWRPQQEAETLAAFGETLRDRVRAEECVLTNAPVNTVRADLLYYPAFTYYADRIVRGGVRSYADLERAEREDGPFRRFLYVQSRDVDELALFAELERRGFPKHTLSVLGSTLFLYDLGG